MNSQRDLSTRFLYGGIFAGAHVVLQSMWGRKPDHNLAAWSGVLFVVVSIAFDHLRELASRTDCPQVDSGPDRAGDTTVFDLGPDAH